MLLEILSFTFIFFLPSARLEEIRIEKKISMELPCIEVKDDSQNESKEWALYELFREKQSKSDSEEALKILRDTNHNGKIDYNVILSIMPSCESLRLFVVEKILPGINKVKFEYYHAIQVYKSKYSKANEQNFEIIVSCMTKMCDFLVSKTFGCSLGIKQILKKMKTFISEKTCVPDFSKDELHFVSFSNYTECLEFIRTIVSRSKSESLNSFPNLLLEMYSSFFYGTTEYSKQKHRAFSYVFEAFGDIINVCALSENRNHEWVCKKIDFFEEDVKDEVQTDG